MAGPEPLYTVEVVRWVLNAAVAHQAAMADPAVLERYVDAACTAVGADAGALTLAARNILGPVVLARTPGVDAARVGMLVTHAAPHDVPGGSVQVVPPANPGGPALVVTGSGNARLLLLRTTPAAASFGKAEAAIAEAICDTCDPGRLVPPGLVLPGRLKQVLDGLLAGRSEREIGVSLSISQQTVHGHAKLLYRRFRVRSRGELLSLWIRRCTGRDASPPG